MAKNLAKHVVTLAIQVGLDQASNGELIQAAEDGGFDVLVTPDKNIRYQQDLSGRKIAIVVLQSGRWPVIRAQLSEVVSAIDEARPGEYIEIQLPPNKPGRYL